jgi:hypothetical protein
MIIIEQITDGYKISETENNGFIGFTLMTMRLVIMVNVISLKVLGKDRCLIYNTIGP